MSGLYQTISDRIGSTCPAVAFVRPATHAGEAEHEALGEQATVLVVPSAERWRPPASAGFKVSQQGVVGFSCVVALIFPGGFEQWEAVRAELLACLCGWQPQHPEAAAPITYAGARLLAYSSEDGQRWIHAFDFNLASQTTYEIQQ